MFDGFTKHAEKYFADNSPAILTAIGVAGAVGAAYLAAKASFRAAAIIQEETDNAVMAAGGINNVNPEDLLDNRAKAELVWREYVPAAVVGTIAVAAIISSNHISTRRAAALASAYSISETFSREYREKVREKIGKSKELAIRDEIAQERLLRKEWTDEELILGSGQTHCFDAWSGRPFKSSAEQIHAAVNYVNHMVNTSFYASLTDFYSYLGLDPTQESSEIGWNADTQLEISITAGTVRNGKPCLIVNIETIPVRSYHRFG
jgi:hypothetical protein